jgi:hypothetical protein
MPKIEWTDSIEKSLDIMKQNLSKLSEISSDQYIAFKKRIEYMSLPLAILSGANAGAIFFLDGYGYDHYINIGCGVASLVVAGVLSYDWCTGSLKQMGKDLAFHRDCENLSNQIQTILSMERNERKMDGTLFLQQKFAEYKTLVNDNPLIEKFKGNLSVTQDTISEQVEDMQEFLYDHWNIIYRPTLRRFKKKNSELLDSVKKAGETVQTIIEPVVEPVVDTAEANCNWFMRKTNLIWKTEETKEEEEKDNIGEEKVMQFKDIYSTVKQMPSEIGMKKFNMAFVEKK